MHRLLIIFLCAISLHASFAQAAGLSQPWPTIENHTVEALTINSKLVFTARFRFQTMNTTLFRPDYGIAPDEMLKGPTGAVLPEMLHGHRYPLYWPKPGTKVLVFVGDSDEMLDLVGLDSMSSFSSPHVIRDFTFQPVRYSAQLLAIVRAELKRAPPATTRTFYTNQLSHASMTFPADNRLLPMARQWVHSEVPAARCAAAHVFAAYPDPVDTPALYELLKDPFTVDDPSSVSPWSGHEYVIRQAALQTLAKRGATVLSTRLFEPRTDLYHPFIWLMLLWGSPIPLYVIARHLVLRQFQQPRAVPCRLFISAPIFTCLYLATVTVLLLLRSTHTVDDLVYAKAGFLLNATSIGGAVQFETAAGWPGESTLVHLVYSPDLTFNPLPAHVVSLRNGTEVNRWEQFHRLAWTDWLRFSARFWRSDAFGGPFDSRLGLSAIHRPNVVVNISHTYIFVFFMLFPVLRTIRLIFHRLYRHQRDRRRLAQRLCLNCGYDLCAHAPGSKCPECGDPITDGSPR